MLKDEKSNVNLASPNKMGNTFQVEKIQTIQKQEVEPRILVSGD
jgi:hypothetical protein